MKLTGLLTLFIFIMFFGLRAQTKINGVCLVSPKYKTRLDGMGAIKRINANWIAICPFAFIYKNSATVTFNTPKNWWGDRQEGLIEQIKWAQKNGLKVCLKPHCWLMNYFWAGEFDLSGTKQIDFEQNYSNYILFLAAIAEKNNVKLLCIGTELQTYSARHPAYFRKLIAQVRRVYSGELCYAANFEEFSNVSFWDALDYIGIDAYFPLSGQKTPTVEVLTKRWATKIIAIKSISKKYNKKVIFTEYGYKSIDFAAYKQWENERISTTDKINFNAQTNAYQAFYESVWQQDFVAGGFIWKWYPQDEMYKDNPNSDYTPQHKPVEKLIKKWYSIK
ncbi:MAG: hypothetical protein AUK44_01000 [Porphyromonadaceae bacterium CG2_30_38_12]|nr:MAG: hypothetical protein AUK44_01000 [Porphyromonadaceae bacterium CG2_30_38_12]